MKHHDRDVSTAASALRSRWMSTLGRGSQPSNTTVSSGPGGGSDPRGTASSSINGKGRGKKADAASVPSDAPASDVASVPSDTPAVSSKVSAAVPSDVPGDKAAVPRDEVVISNDKTAVSSDAPAKSVEMSEVRGMTRQPQMICCLELLHAKIEQQNLTISVVNRHGMCCYL